MIFRLASEPNTPMVATALPDTFSPDKDSTTSTDLGGIAQAAAEYFLFVDGAGNIAYANTAFTNAVQEAGSDIVGNPLSLYLTLLPETTDEKGRMSGKLLLRDGGARNVTALKLSPSGGVRQEIASVVIIEDPLARDRISRRLTFISRHDPVTGLMGRAEAEIAIDDYLGEAVQDRPLWIGLLRLDHDRITGAAQLERAVARLGTEARRRLPANAEMYRIATNFLACIWIDREDGAGHTALSALADRSILAALKVEIEELETRCFQVRPGTRSEGRRLLVKAETLFPQLDEGSAHIPVVLDDPSSGDDLDAAFDSALENGELEFYVQPQVSAETGELLGGELLCRWNHPEQGVLPPHRFISLAESERFRGRFTRWCVDQAFAALEKIRSHGLDEASLALNVSAAMFDDARFVQWLEERQRADTDLASKLEIEITESTLAQNFEMVRDHLAQLRAMGFAIAVDDFGTGYSSLAYLREFPIDRLKIDRSFVRGLLDHEDDALICTAIISLSHVLGIQVIAEGVETTRQARFLREIGCEQIQGFLIARPLPMDAFLAVALNWESIDIGFDEPHDAIDDQDDHGRTLKRIHWKRSFSVDIVSVDKEHADIIKQINKIAEMLRGDVTVADVLSQVEAVVSETKRHFVHEETVMRNIGYPHLQRHKSKHDALISDISGYLANAQRADRTPDPERLLSYLKFWFLRHVITEDRLIERHLNKKEG